MIASRQCFGNRIRVRRHIFPKEFAERSKEKTSPYIIARQSMLLNPGNE